jgi:hypothetical protein
MGPQNFNNIPKQLIGSPLPSTLKRNIRISETNKIKNTGIDRDDKMTFCRITSAYIPLGRKENEQEFNL